MRNLLVSFVLDYVARQKIAGTHLNYFTTSSSFQFFHPSISTMPSHG